MTGPSFLTGFVLVHLLATALAAGLGFSVYRTSWRKPIGKVFTATVASFAVWTVFSMLRFFVTEPWLYVTLTAVKYVGVTTAPVFFFLFGLVYADGERFVTARTVGALLVVPALTLALLVTTLDHGLFYAALETRTVAGRTVLETVRGPAFWGFAVYGWGFLALGSLLLVYGGYRLPALYRTHVTIIVVGILLPWAVSLGYIGYDWPHPAVDPTPIGFAGASALWAVGVFGTSLVDVSPVARSRVVAAIDNPVVVMDDDGRITDVNEAAAPLLRRSKPHGVPATEALPGPLVDRIEAADARADGGADAASLAPDTLELAVDGERRHFRTRGLPLAPDGEHGSVLILTDVTDLTAMRRTLEARNRALERQNDRLDEFASLVSHDLRNPLSVAKGNLELLAEETDSELVGEVRSAHERMETLVDELLELARLGRSVGDADTVSLTTVAESAWENVDAPASTLTVAEDVGTVEADRSRLASVFENLFRNAVEHGSTTPRSRTQGDAIEPGAATPASEDGRDADDPGAGVTVRVGGTADGFFVADDGPGIPERERERVFEHGYTTSETGTGFGLNIVETVVEAHGWSVEVTDSEAGGARFEVDTGRDADASTPAVPVDRAE